MVYFFEFCHCPEPFYEVHREVNIQAKFDVSRSHNI